MNDFIFSVESVTEGHPDKVADQISDAILDELLKKDKNSRVAIETLISNGLCIIAGEVKTSSYVPMVDIARETIKEIGYTYPEIGFDYRSAGILVAIGEQSKDVGIGVDKKDGSLGAGDGGVIFGYACDETKELMPLPIMLANKLTFKLSSVRKDGILPFLRPDGKVLLNIKYENNKAVEVTDIVVNAHHNPEVKYEYLKESIIDEVIKEVIPHHLLKNPHFHINPTGKFVIGGPHADTGLTGRKIVSDSYGGAIPSGGSAFSGKDPTKIDRSASYMARYIAKNLVKSKICTKVLVKLSFKISDTKPLTVDIDTFGTSKVEKSKILKAIDDVFDLSVEGIIKELNLLEPIYKKTAVYGHFGRELSQFLWEKTDKAQILSSF